MPIDQEASKQGHGQINHLLGLGYHDRPPPETPKPMALLTMVPLNPLSPRVAHDQTRRGNHRRIRLPVIRTIECDRPSGEAITQLFQGCLITTPALPIQELACIAITSFPDPELPAFFGRKCHISSSSMTTAFPLGAGLT